MKKPYEYYIEKIKQTYPELKKLFGNYARIEANINAEIAAGGTGKVAAKELYNYTLISFERLAEFYADNELDHKTFEDAMSGMYLTLMEFINKKLDSGKWYKSLISYSSTLTQVTDYYFKKVQKSISNKYYLTTDKKQNNLISKIKMKNDDKEFSRIQIDKEKDLEWLEQIEDVVASNELDEIVSNKNLKALISDILETLRPKERAIVISVFGFDDGSPKSLEVVGKKFHLSKERIRQILAKALRKLRHPSRTKYIEDFVQ